MGNSENLIKNFGTVEEMTKLYLKMGEKEWIMRLHNLNENNSSKASFNKPIKETSLTANQPKKHML